MKVRLPYSKYGYFEYDMASMKRMMEEIASKMNEIAELVSASGKHDVGRTITDEAVSPERYDNNASIQ